MIYSLQQKQKKMIRSASKSSLNKKLKTQRNFNDPNQILIQNIYQTIQQASVTLPFIEFKSFYQQIVLSSIKKAEIQKTSSIYVPFLKKIVSKYMSNLQIDARIILLQVISQAQSFPQNGINLLTKLKYMIIDSQIEYLLSKALILQSKCYSKLNKPKLQQKSLLKSVQFAQDFLLQYINQRQQVRQQITQNIITTYVQLFKFYRENQQQVAEEYLLKAKRISQKIYGEQSQLFDLINNLYEKQKYVKYCVEKYSQKNSKKYEIKNSRATTQVLVAQVDKDRFINVIYCWQQQVIEVNLISKKHQQIIYQISYPIKLDINRINLLKNDNQITWLRFQNQNQISVIEQQLQKTLGIKNQPTVTTKIQFRNITRDQIIKKDQLSSSSDDASFLENKQFQFIRTLGRTQSAKRLHNK